ncbi:MAG: hypothetical protein V4486_00075 [Patescibacteria group bacterium]
MLETNKNNKRELLIAIILFVGISIFFFYVYSLDVDSSLKQRQIFGGIYTVMALFGGIAGMKVSRNWGGYKSLVGKAMLIMSVGLFLQTFGQLFNSYWNIFQKVEIPYPSIGDIGFFGSVLAYIYSSFLLSKIGGGKFSLKLVKNKIWAAIIPVAILFISYFLFLQGYEFDWSNKLKILLDFGYPLGQALYISIAILAFLISRNMLGGIMKKPILFLLFALVMDYLADFVFLYQVGHGTWYTGGIDDYLYFVSYFVMSLALIYTGWNFYKIKNS